MMREKMVGTAADGKRREIRTGATIGSTGRRSPRPDDQIA
jgi:hypothetical protein